MQLRTYLAATGESATAFARRARVPQQTIDRILKGGGTTVATARKIVEATKDTPAPCGGTVRFEDLDPDYAAPSANGDAA